MPHDLTKNQAERRVEMCQKLQENLRELRFICQIVTCYEKWVYFSNPDTQNKWLDPGQVAEPVEKQNRFSKKGFIVSMVKF